MFSLINYQGTNQNQTLPSKMAEINKTDSF